MSTEPKESAKMDPADLWREEVFTDRKVGTIRRLSPVKADGSPDAARKPLFVGEASLLTPAGSLPLSFEIAADSLEKAVAGYEQAVQLAFQDAMDELQEMRRRAQSSLVIPQGGAASLQGLGAAGLPPGAASKLKLP